MIEKGGGSKIPPVYFSVPYGNLINEKAKYIIYPKSFLMVSEEMKKFVQRELDNCIQYEEILTTEVNRRIDNLDETEIKRIAYEAFFVELNTLVQFQFHDSLCRLIEKLSA